MTLGLSTNCTFTLNNPATTNYPMRVIIEAVQDGTGGQSLTFAGTLSAPGAVQPGASAAANAVDVFYWEWRGNRWRLEGVTYAHGNL